MQVGKEESKGLCSYMTHIVERTVRTSSIPHSLAIDLKGKRNFLSSKGLYNRFTNSFKEKHSSCYKTRKKVIYTLVKYRWVCFFFFFVVMCSRESLQTKRQRYNCLECYFQNVFNGRKVTVLTVLRCSRSEESV